MTSLKELVIYSEHEKNNKNNKELSDKELFHIHYAGYYTINDLFYGIQNEVNLRKRFLDEDGKPIPTSKEYLVGEVIRKQGEIRGQNETLRILGNNSQQI